MKSPQVKNSVGELFMLLQKIKLIRRIFFILMFSIFFNYFFQFFSIVFNFSIICCIPMYLSSELNEGIENLGYAKRKKTIKKLFPPWIYCNVHTLQWQSLQSHGMLAMVHASLGMVYMISVNLSMILPWSQQGLIEICQDHGKPSLNSLRGEWCKTIEFFFSFCIPDTNQF